MGMNIFERASKCKLRFATSMGNLATEDLWDLHLENLDNMAVSYDEQLAQNTNKSFISDKSVKDVELQLKFDICKSVIDTRLADKSKAEKSLATKARNAKIMEIIEAKQDDSLKDKSVDELRALMEAGTDDEE